VDEIYARLPAIDINETDNLKLDVGAGIKEAAFKSGQVSIKVENTTQIPSTLTFTLNELLNKATNEPMSFTLDLGGNGIDSTKYNLSNYIAKMKVAAPGEVQTTPIMLIGSTDSTNSPVEVKSGDAFKIDFSMKNIVLDYVEGWLSKHQVNLSTTESTINLPEKFGGLEGIKIGDGRLMITIFNTMGLPIRFEGSIVGTSESGKTATFSLDESIQPGQGGKEEVATIIPPFTPENSNILSFINLPPQRVKASGQAWVGDGATIGRVSSEDYVRAKYALESAFKASWENRTINADTTQLSILPPGFNDNSNDNTTTLNSDVTKDLQKLELHAQIENHLPIGVGIRFRLATDLKNLDKNPDLVLGPIDLPPAPADANGIVTQPVSKESVLSIGENDIRLFQNTSDTPKPLFIATEVLIYSTNGKEVQVFATDYVKVRAFTKIVNRIGNE